MKEDGVDLCTLNDENTYNSIGLGHVFNSYNDFLKKRSIFRQEHNRFRILFFCKSGRHTIFTFDPSGDDPQSEIKRLVRRMLIDFEVNVTRLNSEHYNDIKDYNEITNPEDSFATKKEKFYNQLERYGIISNPQNNGVIQLPVFRGKELDCFCKMVYEVEPEQFRNPLFVVYNGEDGTGQGVLKEFF